MRIAYVATWIWRMLGKGDAQWFNKARESTLAMVNPLMTHQLTTDSRGVLRVHACLHGSVVNCGVDFCGCPGLSNQMSPVHNHRIWWKCLDLPNRMSRLYRTTGCGRGVLVVPIRDSPYTTTECGGIVEVV